MHMKVLDCKTEDCNEVDFFILSSALLHKELTELDWLKLSEEQVSILSKYNLSLHGWVLFTIWALFHL